MTHLFTASIASLDPVVVFELVADWAEFRDSGPPNDVSMGASDISAAEWRSIRFASNPLGGTAFWADYQKQLGIRPRTNVTIVEFPHCVEAMLSVLTRVIQLPLGTAVFGKVFHDAWKMDAGYRRWSLAGGHIDHGWGCMFRGAGHDRLVSRRWLDFGPWRVVHLPDDTTFVQFHDLAITDPVAAYEQAKVGHQRMGIDPIGGYIQGIDLDVIAEVRGVYLPATRTLEIVVGPGNTVNQQDMRVACGLRLHHRLTSPASERVDQIAYVFMDRGDAEAHLHELWLRELECWYLDERGKHRLDEGYRPTPTPPAWVARLSENAVNALR
jgi:hypothetical protein